jgi:hypothetical protein
MALARTNVGWLGATPPQGTGPFDYTAFSPGANALIVAKVLGTINVIANVNSYILTDSSGLSWTKRAQDTATFTADGAFVQIWTAPTVAAPGSITLTLTHTGETSYSMYMDATYYTGHNVGAPVRQTQDGVATGSPTSLTMGMAPLATSELIGCMCMITSASDGAGSSITPVSPAIELDEDYVNTSFQRVQSQYQTGIGTSFGWTSAGAASSPFDQRVMGVIEVAAAATEGGYGTIIS